MIALNKVARGRIILITLSKIELSTPLGSMTAIASEIGLAILSFSNEEKFIQTKLHSSFKDHQFNNDHQATLEITKSWLEGYFLKKERTCALPPLHMIGSSFAIRTWALLKDVPWGTTQSYGSLAKAIGNTKASRAVGRVLGQNPILIMIPCHRILNSQGALTGFSCGLERKIWLLKHEKLL